MNKDDKKFTLIENKTEQKEDVRTSPATPAVMKKLFKFVHVNLTNNKAEYKSLSKFDPEDLR